MRERIRLPVDSDLAATSLGWAMDLLGEEPVQLRVSSIDRSVINNPEWPIESIVDESLKTDSWLLVGTTREVYSDGA